ncbi:hypothetical protein [Lentzea albida]|uniref:Uncharacterized protein n=1 Tax=Lentzea albida TaxID=65499 RepID=A0A1H9BY01_9PSEU|nr:hypothetical protein [Lentzea albida]SEP93637.1 hypothetical protein SAMN04488000_101726 [Lentzea albida]
MPRRRPRPDVLKGLSGRLLADLNRLGRIRNHLGPYDVRRALETWTAWQRSPASKRWLEEPWDHDPYPDHDPFHAREVLEAAAHALPRRTARELRERLRELDEI